MERLNAETIVGPIRLMIAAHGEETYARIDKRLSGSGPHGDIGILAIVGQISDLEDELHSVVDELPVDLLDNRRRNIIGIRSGRIKSLSTVYRP